ncbi:T9SS type A sorting domain-containing protein [candidate division WOR-3 bacterium]|nr:T9SS type A sorting domain-containing protein [candidate division WOR-3 bacterium]
MRKTILFIALAMMTALPVFAQWQTETRITNTTGSSYSAYNSGAWSIAADANDVYLVWRDYTTSQYVRGYVFPIGTPPASPVSGSILSTTTVSYDVAAAAGDGTNGHAVWDYSSHQYYNGYDGSSWGSQYEHYYTGDNMRAQCITNNSAGTTFLATSGTWNNPAFVYRVRYRERSAAGVWSSMTDIWAPSSGDYHYFVHPSICLTPDGSRHISMGIYRTAGPAYTIGHLWSADGTTWSNEYLLPANSAYHVYATSICSDPDGNLFIAYPSYPSIYQVRVLDNVGGSWNTPVTISNAPSSVYYMSICSDINGNVWVAWDALGGSTYEIYYAMRPAGGVWSEPQILTGDDGYASRYPNLTADDNGNVHICWADNRDGNYEIYYNWYKGTGGPGPEEDSIDLVMAQIIRPGAVENPGESFKPACRIWQNLEDTTIFAEVLCRIRDLSTMQNVYEDVLGVYPLESGYNEVSAFKPFTPQGDKEYEAFFVVTHPDDVDVSNNDMTKRFSTEALAKVDATQILAPADDQVNSFDPEAKFVETGGKDYPGAVLHCVINRLTYSDEVYNETLNHDFTANEEYTPKFPKATDLEAGPYEIKFYATDATDIPIGLEMVKIFNYTGIAESSFGDFALETIAPNPFSGSTKINFSLGNPTTVTLNIYDVTGKIVTNLASGAYGAGSHSVNWDADVTPGVYFVRFMTPEFSAVQKTLVIK